MVSELVSVRKICRGTVIISNFEITNYLGYVFTSLHEMQHSRDNSVSGALVCWNGFDKQNKLYVYSKSHRGATEYALQHNTSNL